MGTTVTGVPRKRQLLSIEVRTSGVTRGADCPSGQGQLEIVIVMLAVIRLTVDNSFIHSF